MTNRGRLIATIHCSVAGLLLSAMPASAQFYGAGRGLGYRGGYIPNPYPYPYGGMYYGGDPYGGYLSGAADVINAQGGYLKDVQDAYLKKEQVKSAKLQNRRAAFDEWMYEKANTPTLEEQREDERIQNVLRSQHNPPATEIWSGKALNDLLQDIQQRDAPSGPPIYLNQDLLKEVNVTTGTTVAGAGVLKNGGKLQWPLALMADNYEASRKKIETLAAEAVKQAETSTPNPKTLMELNDSVGKFQDLLKTTGGNIEPNQYIRAKRYLNDLSASLTTLQDANASNYCSKKWAAQGTTVAELVGYMTSQGLKFAPATPGDEAAYNMLQRALADYDTAVSQVAPAKQKPQLQK